MTASGNGRSVRLDKWLWAARFFKTRSLAADAVGGGKVHLNTARVKPARIVKLGDTLEIRRGHEQFVVVVEAISSRRGPAAEAQKLYSETTESRAAREAQAEQRKLFKQSYPTPPSSRPNKKHRRQIIRFRRRDQNDPSKSD